MMQILANALVSAAGYLLVGVGFSLIYTSTRFFHFAHGIVLTAGAYVTFILKVWSGFPLSISIFGGIIASTLLGIGMEWNIYRPLRRRNASPVILLLASLGIYASLQALISLTFGSGTKTFRSGVVPTGLLITGMRVTGPQIAIIVISGACCLVVWLLLRYIRVGKMIRAVACDPDLAEVFGLNRDYIIRVVFLIGSALAGIAGVLLTYDADMTPMMGFRVLLMGMVAVIIGGIGEIPGIALGALLLGLAQHLTAWWFSSRWQDAIVFVILILFLLVRPQGFLGKPLRKTAI
jgi:branched-chain amino acid transport system permease protein